MHVTVDCIIRMTYIPHKPKYKAVVVMSAFDHTHEVIDALLYYFSAGHSLHTISDLACHWKQQQPSVQLAYHILYAQHTLS
jgi:hypothetical protein